MKSSRAIICAWLSLAIFPGSALLIFQTLGGDSSSEIRARIKPPKPDIIQSTIPKAGVLEYRGARLEFSGCALDKTRDLTMIEFSDSEAPEMSMALAGVTASFYGLRLGPANLKLDRPATLHLPYDPEKIPGGMTPEDIYSYYFDSELSRWIALARIEVDSKNHQIVSSIESAGDVVNAVLTLPDHVEGKNFAPNSITELQPASPDSGITLIDTPVADPSGEAHLSFPIEAPPGRHGLQPELAFSYSSGNSNGWLGVGWNLDAPNIQVDTTFGVPRYSTNSETETYILNGDFLAPATNPNGSGPCHGNFIRRVEGSFQCITRHGNSPDSYYWEVTDQSGVSFIYGKSENARLQDYQEPHNIFRWNLEEIIDTHGNTARFTYYVDNGNSGEPWTQSYLKRIEYTGAPGLEPFYSIEFVLDDGNRLDRFSSGRPGFKTLTRFLLKQVVIQAGGELVRRYDLQYQVGGFSKTLLQSIGVIGEDSKTPFYEHSFNYHTVPMSDNMVAGFTPQQTWTGMSEADDETHTQAISTGLQSFTGLGPPGCLTHLGIGVGSGLGTTGITRSFADINGDGLTDRIDENGVLELNQFNAGNSQPGFVSRNMPNTNLLGNTLDLQFNFSGGLHTLGENANIGVSWVWSHANQNFTMADVNGDGWPDLVETNGAFEVKLNEFGESFAEEPVPWEGYSFDGVDLSVPEEDQDLREHFNLSNAVRKLVLPYTGQVTITGAVQKLASGGLDGVKVSIYHNSEPVWEKDIGATDTSACTPGPDNSCLGNLTLSVQSGDRLYFMADSVVDTSFDTLAWAPTVTYQGHDASELEPYGSAIFSFNAEDDFRLAGGAGAFVATLEGTVVINGAIAKQTTADDVTVTIVRRRCDESTELYRETLTADSSGVTDNFPAIPVQKGDQLALIISSDSQIDTSRVAWTPTVSYQSTTDPKLPPERIPPQDTQVEYSVRNPLPLDLPTLFAMESQPGELPIQLNWTSPTPTNGPVFLYVQGLHELFGKFKIPNGSTSYSQSLTANLTNPPLYITVLADNQGDMGSLTATANGASLPVNSRYGDLAGDVFSGGYHLWYYGEWNGDVTFSEPTPPTDPKEPPPPYVPGVAFWQGLTNIKPPVPGPLWGAAGFDLQVSATTVKPSRRGGNVAVELDTATGKTTSGPTLISKSYGQTLAFEAGLGGGFQASAGENKSQVDLIDMNGDRYPDQVAKDQVRFSNGDGGFGDLESFVGLKEAFRVVKDGNLSASIGIGVTYSKKNSEGETQDVLNTMPSVGTALSLSQPRVDLFDVNGDGLPDQVSMEPDANTMTVRLNLGYRFGAEELWTLPNWDSDDICDRFLSVPPIPPFNELDNPNAMGLSQSVTDNVGLALGPIGSGVGTTLSRTVVDFQDINGDGLVDHLFKDQDEDFFRVKLNLGNSWASETKWHVPPWETSLYEGGLFPCQDAVSYNVAINVNGSIGVPLCIPIPSPPLPPVVGLQIEISGQSGFTTGGMQLMLQDMDGNGLADHVLKKSGDDNVYVKLNQVSQVNLLTEVTRPLGGSFTLAYKRQGNRVDYTNGDHLIDMPENQWVLASTTLNDGQNSSYVTTYEYFNDAYFDREERENYGYARIKATFSDDSTAETHYYNQNFYTRKLVKKMVRRDAQDQLYIVKKNHYQLRKIQSNAYFPELSQEATFYYEGQTASEADFGKSTLRAYQYSDLGNMVHFKDFGDTGESDNVIADIAYYMDDARYIIKPNHITVTNQVGDVLSERLSSYSQLGDMKTLTAILTGGVNPATGEEYQNAEMVTTMTYDDLGNLETVVDPSNFTLRYGYDDDTRSLVTSIVDSFGYATLIGYNMKYGLPITTTDQNNNTMTMAYDQFGRLQEVRAPGDASTEPTIGVQYYPDASPAYAVTHHQDITNLDNPIDTVIFMDGLGRNIQTKRDTQVDTGEQPQTGMQVSGKLEFDNMGRIQKEGQPIFSSEPVDTFVDAPLNNPTAFSYDILDRMRLVTFPQETQTRIDYGFGDLDGVKRLLRTRTDALGRKTNFYSLVTGPVVGVEQFHQQQEVTQSLYTRYTYSPLLSVLSASDPSGNNTHIDYDTLGRRISVDNPDMGKDAFRYTMEGNLGAKITANLRSKNQEIQYQYTYHRLDAIIYPESDNVSYTYGAPGAPYNRANRIYKIVDQSGIEERYYSPLGQVVKTSKLTNSVRGRVPLGPFTTQMTYDSFNRLLSVTYPDGEALSYGFDAGGRVSSATGRLNGVDTEYVSFVGYDQFGEMMHMVFGNGVEEHRTFDPTSRFLSNIQAQGGPSRLFQNLEYSYNDVGSITGLSNDVDMTPSNQFGGPSQQEFEYDDLYRLTKATGSFQKQPRVGSDYVMDMGYDNLGNITSKNQRTTIQRGGSPFLDPNISYNWAYEYEATQPNAPSHVGNRGFTYDLNGNQKTWKQDHSTTRRTVTWDEENRITQIDDTGILTRFLYNASGERTNKRTQADEFIYVNNYFTLRNASIGNKQIFMDDRRVATRIGQPAIESGSGLNDHPPGDSGSSIRATVFFYHPDKLGSTQFVTNKDAKVYDHLEYFPFGEPWVSELSSAEAPPYLFTGKQLDNETGLYYFEARYQDPRQSQFVSPDPSYDGLLDVDALETPDPSLSAYRSAGQMYVYTKNDPVNLVDPTGMTSRQKRDAREFRHQQRALNPKRPQRKASMPQRLQSLTTTRGQKRSRRNRKKGSQFEKVSESFARNQLLLKHLTTQVTVQPYDATGAPATYPSGRPLRIRPDVAGVATASTPNIALNTHVFIEAKATATAPFTRGQALGLPLLKNFGGVVTKGTRELPTGTGFNNSVVIVTRRGPSGTTTAQQQ